MFALLLEQLLITCKVNSMKKFFVLVCLLVSCVESFAQVQVRPVSGGGGGAPNVTSLSPGSGFSNAVANLVNGGTLQLGRGTYTVNASILNSNFNRSTAFLGITMQDKTNVSILGVPGQTIIDASGSGPGELLWITNCSGVYISGVTFRGYTNHNIAAMPSYGNGTNNNAYLWAGVNVYRCANLTFYNCSWIGHSDHGLQDKGAETVGYVAVTDLSTNNIVVDSCYFEDIGQWRTNTTTSVNNWDGTAIVPTGWTIRNCTFKNLGRGIEPYNEGDSESRVFYNCAIENNNFYNMVEFAVSPAGSTNGHFVQVIGNKLFNDRIYSYHGSNFGPGQTFYSPCFGFYWNGGRGWVFKNNLAQGTMQHGFYSVNSLSFLYDGVWEGNTAREIRRGDGSAAIGFVFGDNANTAAAASSVRNGRVLNNFAINCDVAGFQFMSGRDMLIEGNQAYNGTAYTSDNLVFGGMLFGVSGGTSASLTNWTVRGNRVFADNGGAYGITLQNNIQNLVFENNEIQGNFVFNGGITNRSGAAVATLGIPKTYGAAVNIASIGINAAVDTVITAAGVTTNDSVTVNIPPQWFVGGAAAEVSYFAWATNSTATDGQIILRVVNSDTTAATVDFPSVNMVFQARQMRIHGQ